MVQYLVSKYYILIQFTYIISKIAVQLVANFNQCFIIKSKYNNFNEFYGISQSYKLYI